jgi:hypothetical protein
MQEARHQPGATVVDGKFFVAGGYDPVRTKMGGVCKQARDHDKYQLFSNNAASLYQIVSSSLILTHTQPSPKLD